MRTLDINKINELEIIQLREKLSNTQYANFLKDKRIILVGPSKKLLATSNREYIDSFDIVIRMKDAVHSFQKMADYQEHIGTKFDVLYNGNYCYTRKLLEKHCFQYIIQYREIILSKDAKDYFETSNIHRPELISTTEEFQLLEKLYSYKTAIEGQLIKIKPSTGLFAIFHLLLFQPRELTIIGMDFYQEGGNMFKSNDKFIIYHSGKSEKEFFFQLLELNKDRIKIKFDI